MPTNSALFKEHAKEPERTDPGGQAFQVRAGESQTVATAIEAGTTAGCSGTMETGEFEMNEELAQSVVFDRVACFQLFAVFAGDCTRTAHALGIRELDVRRAADDGDWDKQLASIITLRKSTNPQAIERGINAALNFVLAHRFRLALERIVARISMFTNEELDAYVFEGTTKEGLRVNKLNTRALADLASGLEKMSAMTYAALGDTASERSKREEEGDKGESSGAIHAAIARALADVTADHSPRAQLLDAQIASAEVIATQAANSAVKPTDIYSNDDH